jgi:hypothetical protein
MRTSQPVGNPKEEGAVNLKGLSSRRIKRGGEYPENR